MDKEQKKRLSYRNLQNNLSDHDCVAFMFETLPSKCYKTLISSFLSISIDVHKFISKMLDSVKKTKQFSDRSWFSAASLNTSTRNWTQSFHQIVIYKSNQPSPSRSKSRTNQLTFMSLTPVAHCDQYKHTVHTVLSGFFYMMGGFFHLFLNSCHLYIVKKYIKY